MTATTSTANTKVSPWVIVWICFFALAFMFSARASVGLTMTTWEKELGWSKSFISGGAALALVVMAIVSPVVGNLVDRYGPRDFLSGGLFISAVGFSLLALLPSQLTYILGFSLLGGVGFGTAAVHLVSTVIAKLFSENRGFATGVGTAGATGGQLLIVPVVTYVMSTVSWQAAVLSVATLLVLLGIVIRLVLPAMASDAKAQARATTAEPIGARLRFLLASPVFHILFWSFFICGVTTSGAVEIHFVPYAAFCGFPLQTSSFALGLLAAVNMLGMMFSGWLTDRVNRPLLLGSIYIMRGFSYILLLYIGTDPVMLFAFAVMFGIFDYSTVPPTASLAASKLGLPIMGLAMGLISGGHSLGGAVGAYAGGLLFDYYARYTELWWLTFATAIFAGLMVYLLKDDRLAKAA